MTASSRPRPPLFACRVADLLSVAAATCLALLMRWPGLHLPLERDEGAYGYVAWRWLQGAVPYQAVFDHKPPLTYGLYALFWSVGAPTALTLRIGATVWFLLGVMLVYALGVQLWDRASAALAAGLYALVGSTFSMQGLILNTEQALVVPALAMLWLLVRWFRGQHWLAAGGAGAALAAVTLIKPTATPLLAGLVVLGWGCMPLRQWLRGVISFGLGGLLVALPIGLYFAAQGAWHDLLFALVTYNQRYLVQSQTEWRIGALADLLVPIAALSITACGGAALAFVSSGGSHSTLRRQRIALLGWTLALMIAALVSLRAYVHYYFPLLPGLALLAAAAIRSLAQQPHAPTRSARIAHKLAPLALVLVLIGPWITDNIAVGKLAPAAQSERLYGLDGELFATAEPVAAWIRANTSPTTPIWVWGAEPEVYLLAERPAVTRFIYSYPLMLFPALEQEVLHTVAQQPPEVVIFYGGARPPAFETVVLARGLRLQQTIGKFEIWARS